MSTRTCVSSSSSSSVGLAHSSTAHTACGLLVERECSREESDSSIKVGEV